jgi:hypothetical protein
MHTPTPPLRLQERDAAFAAAALAIKDAKARHACARQHRAIRRLSVGPALWLQLVLLPGLFCGLLVLAEPALTNFWRSCFAFWFAHLDLPLQETSHAASINALRFDWRNDTGEAAIPGFSARMTSMVFTFLLFAATFRMQGRMVPLQYLLRILCGVQGIALLFFWYAPAQFPYTVSDHLQDLLTMGHILILAIPLMLAVGYYLLHQRLSLKLAHTLGILGYFIVMIPHKAVLHTLILYKTSVLYMPLLYVCFGAVFDVLLFVALYSWLISMLPEQDTQ